MYEIAKYNNNVSKGVTGLESNEWKLLAKQKGLPSKQRISGKEAMRNINNNMATAVSFADTCKTKYNATTDEAIDLGKSALPTIEKLNYIIERHQQKQLQ